MRTLSIVLAGALLLAACDRKPAQEAAPPQPPAATIAPAAPAPAATPPAPVAPPSGEFDAISNTAMGVTGDLTGSNGALTSAQGQSYTLSGVSTLKAAEPYAATKASFASLINVPADAELSVFKVLAEDPGKARNGGFCGKTPTTFLVTHSGVGVDGQPAYLVVAFSGAAPPSAASAETELCGTFMYAPRYD